MIMRQYFVDSSLESSLHLCTIYHEFVFYKNEQHIWWQPSEWFLLAAQLLQTLEDTWDQKVPSKFIFKVRQTFCMLKFWHKIWENNFDFSHYKRLCQKARTKERYRHCIVVKIHFVCRPLVFTGPNCPILCNIAGHHWQNLILVAFWKDQQFIAFDCEQTILPFGLKGPFSENYFCFICIKLCCHTMQTHYILCNSATFSVYQ